MRMLLELALDRSSHALRGRIFGAERGMLPLDLLQLPEKLIVLPVREIRFIEYVILVACLIEELSKLLRPFARVAGLRLTVLLCWH